MGKWVLVEPISQQVGTVIERERKGPFAPIAQKVRAIHEFARRAAKGEAKGEAKGLTLIGKFRSFFYYVGAENTMSERSLWVCAVDRMA